ncbi:hypothetical protein P154DRAFT_94159 [Amniculicola lignicola CBS 123094]|uniref:Uncharacterized protein n=1 Tax=Amniculicola lignicola CBS 123094 TaxID=1392246 RepID=A0A6A5WRQ7_9PLEO|nr:hypothetical protein P154DRAFT_94159 [Amniculicola lignicola CBS 123094]
MAGQSLEREPKTTAFGSRNKLPTTRTTTGFEVPYDSYPSALKTALQRADALVNRTTNSPARPSNTAYVIIHQQCLPHSYTECTIWGIHKSARTANHSMAAQFVSNWPEVLDGNWATSPWEQKALDMCVYEEISMTPDAERVFSSPSGEDLDVSEKDWERLSPVSTATDGDVFDGEDSEWSTEDEDEDESDRDVCPCKAGPKEARWHFATSVEGMLGISLVVEEPGKKTEVVKSIFICCDELQE